MQPEGDKLTVFLLGELDHHAARDVRDRIDAELERGKYRTLTLDFSSLSFMDSSGIGLIMGRYRLMKAMGGAMQVAGASERMDKVMRLVGSKNWGSCRHRARKGRNQPMKPNNEMKLSFPSRSANEGFARAAVAAFVAQLDPAVDELADIRTAVSEAVTNCIVHAYPDAIGEIILQARLYPEGRVVIKIRDRGCGIEDIRQAMEPLFTTGGEERSGLGFSVMESFSDKLRVTSRKGKGTVVTLEKYIAPRERQAKTN